MGKCINHPECDTSYLCMKHTIYLCDVSMKKDFSRVAKNVQRGEYGN
jgi:hypothetical protein